MTKRVQWTLAIGVVFFLLVIYAYGGDSDIETDDGGGGTSSGGSAGVIANIMAQFENSNPAYNNPDAIQGTGDTGTTAPNGLGIFSSQAAGAAAGVALVAAYIVKFPFLTITQAVARYTTGSSSNTSESITNESNMIGDALGVDPNSTTLGDLGDGDDDSGDD